MRSSLLKDRTKAGLKINEIIKIRIQGAQNHDIECILPKIIRDTIKNIYQTSFRLLREFGTKRFEKSKRHVVKSLEEDNNKLMYLLIHFHLVIMF